MKAHLFEQPSIASPAKSATSALSLSAPQQPSYLQALTHSSQNNPGYTPNLISNSRSKMKPQLSNLPSLLTCHHLYPSGRRCRFLIAPGTLFCDRHIDSGLGSVPDADISRHFGPDPLNFKSACEVNDFLCSLARLMVENRISARRASVLAYIASLELRTLPAIDQELNPDDELMPRLIFDRPVEMEPSSEPPREETPTASHT